jgi:nucleoside 2-deoxyribosyltransferase
MTRAYLAGPTVFAPDFAAQAKRLKALCAEHGIEGVISEVSLEGLEFSSKAEIARYIFEANMALLRSCDLVIADLTPFRGPHADDGTAFELGAAYVLAKPIFAYSAELRPLAACIPARAAGERLVDAAGWQVEDFGLPHNLMLAASIEGLYATPQDAIAAAQAFLRARG